MSALGQKRTFRNVRAMSALPPKADICIAAKSCLFAAGALGFLTFTQCAERCRQLRRAMLTQRLPCERPSWRHTPLGATRLTPFRAKPRDRAASPSCAPTRRTAPRSAGTHHTCPLGNRPADGPTGSVCQFRRIVRRVANTYSVTNWNSLLRKLCQLGSGADVSASTDARFAPKSGHR